MRITVRSITLTVAGPDATAFTPIAAQQGPPPPGFGPGPGGMGGPGGPGGEIKLVARFDKNGDNRLNTEERKAARAELAQNGGGRGFGRMGGGGELREPPAPGARLTPADVKSYPASVPFYDSKALRTIFFQFETEDWEKELLAFNNTDVEVPATLTRTSASTSAARRLFLACPRARSTRSTSRSTSCTTVRTSAAIARSTC